MLNADPVTSPFGIVGAASILYGLQKAVRGEPGAGVAIKQGAWTTVPVVGFFYRGPDERLRPALRNFDCQRKRDARQKSELPKVGQTTQLVANPW